MKQADINPFIKIHLAKEKDSGEPFCKVTLSYHPKLLTNYVYKVTCKNCLRRLKLMERLGRYSPENKGEPKISMGVPFVAKEG